ncbi:von Willebrand factor type A domain-containing protein [Devosia sp. ZB163]|uniref:vWA domain-containing protein n=1 Tax=Devosia sp. ZB163 TaxID=3025938 RepID=UPI0023629CAB|nr:VWA domain-containing protein [Devosia sp. ZB163]MDC9825224.1 von Willebrand factor type A domain-containing protein [Devosia sp. ZB163]
MSNHMNDKLNSLRGAPTPGPSEAARRRALDAAMLAFDAEQEKTRNPAQGNPLIERLRSILANAKGIWTMDNRLSYGLGTAAVALLLLPLGYQLYTSTAITPMGVPPVVVSTTDADRPVAQPEPAPLEIGRADELKKEAAGNAAAATAAQEVPAAVGADASTSNLAAAMPEGEADLALRDEAAPQSSMAMDASPPMVAPAPMAEMRMAAPKQMAAPGVLQVESFASTPAPMTRQERIVVLPTEPSGDAFTGFTESPVKVVKTDPVSTFSIDVDTASYGYVRRSLTEGWVPEPDTVRLEELINYFDYNYPLPTDAAAPFKPTFSVYPTPWNGKTQIVQIGIKGYVPPVTEDKASNLVFLIDTSGSMDEPDKLPLLKRAFALLVEQLGANDTISIVAYAGSAGVVLEPTKGSEKAKILGALENLSAGGSTAGAEGIELAYRLAEQSKVSGGVNRVILATDGDFNVGIDDPEDLKTFIKGKRDTGVFLSVLGFGQGNLGDDTMQALAQNGNGNASYIDSFKEAQKVLVEDAGGTLETIAKDVKIQVEFNPAVVSEYRLIGYETRALNREDFNNDKVDAGEIGAGTTVTALYEITPVGSGAEFSDPLRYEQGGTAGAAAVPASTGEIGYLKLRYKLPEGDSSTLVEQPIGRDLAVTDLGQVSDDYRFAAAVAAFGQKLKGSNYGEMSWNDIRTLAQGARGADEKGYRAEFMQLVDMAKVLAPDDRQ